VAPRSIIIDCDPGVDDAIALLLAFASPEDLDILAVTTTAGNVDAVQTARNARMIRQIAGRRDVPVYAGATAPLVRQPVQAGHFHGESGLGDLAVFEPTAPLAPGHAAAAIARLAMERPAGSVCMAVTGPMTNLALALRLEPEVAGRLGPVAIMGGARREGGNITASAEYNVFADPHAAAVVFGAGLGLTVFGLDVTHQVRATPARVAAMRALQTPGGRAASSIFDFCVRVQSALAGWDSPPLHDPCTLAWFIAPRLFETVPANIQVETGAALTLGHTAVEFRVGEGLAANARWAIRADADGVFALLLERLGRA
jgi:purine nucleosidase